MPCSSRRSTPDLREAFRREMELFVDSVFREDRSVLDLLTADYTFVNERLAAHYGIPDVRGDQFRRVTLADSNRCGLLGQGRRADGDVLSQSHRRRCCAAHGFWRTSRHAAGGAAAGRRGVHGEQGRREGPHGPRRSWRSIGPTRRATPATASWIRWASRSRTSTRSASWRAKDRYAAHRDRRLGQAGGRHRRSNGPAICARRSDTRPEQFVQTLTEKLHDVRARPERGVLRHARGSHDRSRLGARRLSFSSIVMGIVKSAPFQTKAPEGHQRLSREGLAREAVDGAARIMFITRSICPAARSCAASAPRSACRCSTR